MPERAGLYERDYFAWTQDQAALLRAWPEALRPNAIDIGHLAAEIEDLGRSQRNAARSLLRQILLHLAKLRHVPEAPACPHWREEVAGFRAQLEDIFADSPSLRAQRQDLAGAEWPRAARVAARLFQDMGAASFDSDGPMPFDLDAEVLNPDWFP